MWVMHRDVENGRRESGFTLIEILVVLVILGIMLGVVAVNVMDRPDQARMVKAKSDVDSIMTALKLYRMDNGTYPSAQQGLQALLKSGSGRSYLEKLPKDPWGNEYQYLNPGVSSEVDVASYGADKQAGGEGVNADIGSWETPAK